LTSFDSSCTGDSSANPLGPPSGFVLFKRHCGLLLCVSGEREREEREKKSENTVKYSPPEKLSGEVDVVSFSLFHPISNFTFN